MVNNADHAFDILIAFTPPWIRTFIQVRSFLFQSYIYLYKKTESNYALSFSSCLHIILQGVSDM